MRKLKLLTRNAPIVKDGAQYRDVDIHTFIDCVKEDTGENHIIQTKFYVI